MPSASAFLDEAPSASAFLDEKPPSASAFLDATASILDDPEVQKFIPSGPLDVGSDADARKRWEEETKIDPLASLKKMHEAYRGPAIPIPKPENKGIGTGIARGAIGLVEGLESPENIALMASIGGAPAAVRNIAVNVFRLMMTKNAIEQGVQASEPGLTPGERAERLTGAVGSGALAAIHEGKAPDPTRFKGLSAEEADRLTTQLELKKLAPETPPPLDIKAHTDEQIIDGWTTAKKALLKDFSDQPPEVQKQRQQILDSLDEQLLTVPREVVSASEARTAQQGSTSPAATLPATGIAAPPSSTESGRSPAFAQALREQGAPLTAEAVEEPSPPQIAGDGKAPAPEAVPAVEGAAAKPVKMVSAAYRTTDGGVVSGIDHMDADMKARGSGKVVDYDQVGFIGEDGKFYNRSDAYKAAKGQVDTEADNFAKGELHTGKLETPFEEAKPAEDLPKGGDSVEKENSQKNEEEKGVLSPAPEPAAVQSGEQVSDPVKISNYALNLPEGAKKIVRDVFLHGKSVEEAVIDSGMTKKRAQEVVDKARPFLEEAKTVEPPKERTYVDEPSVGGRRDALDIMARADAGEKVSASDIFGEDETAYRKALQDEMSDDPEVADKGQSDREKLEEALPEGLRDILYGREPKGKGMKRARGFGPEGGYITIPKPLADIAEAAGESVKKFAEEDLKPVIVGAAKNAVEGTRQIKNFVAPALADEHASTTAGIVRQNAAELARSHEVARKSMQQASDFFDKQSNSYNLAVIDAIESGAAHPNPEVQKFAATMRKAFDERVAQIRALGTGKLEQVITDYFPHIWKDPAKAETWLGQIFGKRPLEGSKSFLKQRTIPTTAEGIARGLEPVSYNPVELTLMKLHEMDRYIMGQKIMVEMKDKGLAKFVRASERPEPGDVKINDKVAQVVQMRPTVKADGTLGAPEMIVRGHYYAPEGAARIINNYLSPGLRGVKVFDAMRWLGNTMNQAQLGLSAFHLGFVSVDSGVSKVALGIEHLAEGRPIEATKAFAQSPIAPIQNLVRGNKMLEEYYKPGSQGREVAELMDGAMKAGARVTMDSFYRTDMWKNMQKAWRSGNVIGAALRLPFAALEKTMWPTLEYAVPRMKMGMFADMARAELERIGPSASIEEKRAVMAKAWDSVDNRMGQLVYDNLFWNKVFKDSLMVGTRSVGWNLGTFRELGGGLVDTAATPARIARKIAGGEKPGEKVVTHRMAYTMALPVVVGTLGAIYQYLHTGKMPGQNKDGTFGGDESAVRDMLLPRTGNINEQGEEERAELPSYMKDVFAYSRHPGQTLINKAAPEISTIGQMLGNKDFYGTQIVNPDDPLFQKVKSEAGFVAKQLTPFSIRGAQKREGASKEAKAESFIGIVPAPAELTRTPAHQAMVDAIMSRVPQGARTKEDETRRELQKSIVKAAKSGVPLGQAIADAGAKVTSRQKSAMARAAKEDPRQLMFSHLSVSEARKVYALSNGEEKRLFGRMLNLKEVRAKEPLTATAQPVRR